MTFCKKFDVTVTTSSTGGVTTYTTGKVNGIINAIKYTKASSGSYSDGVDFNITTEDTGLTIWAQNNVNASATVAPRQQTHSTAGIAVTYGSTGNMAVRDKIAVADERIKLAVTSGGSSKTGTFSIIME